MRSDISPAKKYANWDTVLVLEEMEAELDDSCDISDGTNDVNDPAPKRQRILVSNYVAVIIFVIFASDVDFLIGSLMSVILQFSQSSFVHVYHIRLSSLDDLALIEGSKTWHRGYHYTGDV